MKLLITGICGFVGSTLAECLLENQEDLSICGIDNLMRPGSETNRARLNIAHPGQQQGRQQIFVTQPTADTVTHLLQQVLTRCVFQQADKRFDLRAKPHPFRFETRLGRGNWR